MDEKTIIKVLLNIGSEIETDGEIVIVSQAVNKENAKSYDINKTL